jgi:hypothetical protein
MSTSSPPTRSSRVSDLTVRRRFWTYVDKSGGADACWPWTKSKSGSRREYGQYHWYGVDPPIHAAHVAAHFFTTGKRRRGSICHKCDNPICCNPKHLYVGTQLSNMQDMARRNRTSSKLTYEQVRRILVGGETSRTLSSALNVTAKTINCIRRGEKWRYHDARSKS